MEQSGINVQMNNKFDTRWGVFKFKHAALGFLLGVFIFPPYFGIDIGFDLTVLRFFEMVLLCFIFANKIRKRDFIGLVVNSKYTFVLAFYFGVTCYTNILRGMAIAGILNEFFGVVLVFYLMLYLIKYEYGINGFIKILKRLITAICLIALLELLIGFPPMTLLDTLNKSGRTGGVRFGVMRISGNFTTSNGFGLATMLYLPIAVFDEKNGVIDIIKNRWRFVLVIVTAFMTGSRLAVGISVLETALLFILSPRGIRKKTAFWGVISLTAVTAVVILLQDISFFHSIIQTFLTAVDEVLGTQFSAKFGADPESLYNSTYYRELLWKGVFIEGDWLNPLLGRGTNYYFGLYVDGYLIRSIDNYYVGIYVTYAIPGLIAFLLMSVSFIITSVKNAVSKRNPVCTAFLVSLIGYYISLWYLDQLGTLVIMMALFALSTCELENKGIFSEESRLR